MTRYLTGIQSTGQPHLGNVLGAIEPAVAFSKRENQESFFFIADMHSLTTLRDAEMRLQNVRAVAAAWLACGFDVNKNTLYVQSHLPQVAELTWYLSCFTPYPMLANAHSFKDKSENLAQVNAGLFNYPVLMAADILLYDADVVPVGKDQIQHLEITRDIALKVNHHYEAEILRIPETHVREDVMIIPGTDGRKMSKSYGNTVDIFAPEKVLKKQVMGIVTDSTPLEEPKNPDTCNVVTLYKQVASKEAVVEMEKRYREGNYGYGHAKKELLETLLSKYAGAREDYDRWMSDPKGLDEVLNQGADKAAFTANAVLNRVRKVMGFGS